ncbi:hypothetical protein JCM9279_005414 [Rhodotorula babjevae]
MHIPLASLALVSAVLLAAAQQVTPPPTLVQCAEAALTLQGGVAPYTVSILPGAQLSGDPLEVLPVVTASGTVNWLVDIAEGQRVTFRVEHRRRRLFSLGLAHPVLDSPTRLDLDLVQRRADVGKLC